MPHLLLAPGSSLVPRADGLLLVSPDERFAAITGTPRELTDVGWVLGGHGAIPAAGVAADIATAALDWGVATLVEAPPVRTAPGRLSDHLSAAAVAEAMSGVRGPTPRPVITDVLDDDALTTMVATAAAPLLPVHRELGRLVAGPVLGDGLGWRDVRFRRLAASPAPEELRLLWRTWAEVGARHDVEPDPATLAAGVRRLLAWLDTHHDRLADHQLVVPLDAAPPSTHPVLPVPDGLWDRASA